MSYIKPILDTHVAPHNNIAKPVLGVFQRLTQQWQELAQTLNGTIEFGSPTSGPVNVKGSWKTATTPAVINTDFTVVHNLGHPVVNHTPSTKNAACDVYISPTANPKPNTQIILRATVGNVALTFFMY
jgi:hypothetical protein